MSLNAFSIKFNNPEIKIYRVGGFVRDTLLNLTPKDSDWMVTGATPEEMSEAGFIPVGKDFPVFLHPKSNEEFALARCEKKVAQGYHGFEFNTSPEISVEEDLMRRDLTVNAIAEDSNGNLIDPFNGQQDIKNKILRHVSDSFSEDPLRVLRVAKFYARYQHLGFTVAPETLEIMKQLSTSGELEALANERIWQETLQALMGDAPSHYFYLLKDCYALELLFPAIYHLFGKPQPVQYHPEIDSGVHAMMVLDRACQLSDSMLVRFGALCHDLGKSDTPSKILPSHRGHEARGVKHVEALNHCYTINKSWLQFAKKVCKYHTHMHKLDELRASTILELLESFNAFHKENTLHEFALICQSDAQGRLGFENIDYPQLEILLALREVAIQIKAKDFLDKYQGVKLKNAMNKARIEAIDNFKAQQKTGK